MEYSNLAAPRLRIIRITVILGVALYFLLFCFLSIGYKPNTCSSTLAERQFALRVYRAGFMTDMAHFNIAISALDWMHPFVRREAALALGQMESVRALPALYRALGYVPQSQPDMKTVAQKYPWLSEEEYVRRFISQRSSPVLHHVWVDPAIRIAISRIKTAQMHGVARVLAFEAVFLFTHPDPLSDRFAADELFKETIEDILVEERARGCHVAWMAPCFRLDAGGRMRVKLANKPQKERIKVMVDEIATADICRDREMQITMALYREGPAVEPIITDRLRADAKADRYGRPGWNTLLQMLERISNQPVPSAPEFIRRAKGHPDMFKRPLHKTD